MKKIKKKTTIIAISIVLCIGVIIAGISIKMSHVKDNNRATETVDVKANDDLKNINQTREKNTEEEENENYDGKAYYYSELEKLIVELSDLTD